MAPDTAAPRRHRWHEEPGGWSCACGVICDHEAEPCGRHGECKIGLAPFEDGWPGVPSLTVTLDGKAIMTVPLYADDRRFYEVGPYTIWVATP